MSQFSFRAGMAINRAIIIVAAVIFVGFTFYLSYQYFSGRTLSTVSNVNGQTKRVTLAQARTVKGYFQILSEKDISIVNEVDIFAKAVR